MFDENYTKFIDALILYLPNTIEKNIFEMIQELNNWVCIFPTDTELKKAKLDDNILDTIFNDDSGWTFKKLTRNSGHKILIKEIYYKTFGRQIILTKTDKSKHTIYTINTNIHDAYRYCIENLVKYNDDIKQHDAFDDNEDNLKINFDVDIFDD